MTYADELRALAEELAQSASVHMGAVTLAKIANVEQSIYALAAKMEGKVVVDPDEFIAQLKAEVARQFDEMLSAASEAAERYEGDGEAQLDAAERGEG